MAVATLADPAQLLERDEALAALRTAHGEACAGHGRIVFVGGEAGVGKTALLHAFCSEVGREVRVLTGACDPLATPRPLGPFEDIADAVGPDLTKILRNGSRAADVLGALRTAFERGPHVLVLEDVHWADEASLDVLRLLGRRMKDLPALVIGTYRDDELAPQHPLLVALGELATARGIVRLSLPCLSREAVRELADGSGIDPAELYDTTGGNPFFLTEVLAAGGELLPASLREAVLARFARLDGAARELVKAVSVAPSSADSRLLDRLGIDVGAPLEEALASGILRADGTEVAFRHELGRRAIESSLTPAETLSLNTRMITALEAEPALRLDLARLVHHAEAAGDRDAVLRYAPPAAERASSLGAHREAAAYYAIALRVADEQPLERRAELLQRQSEAYYLTDDQAAAIEALEEAVEHYRHAGETLREAAGLGQLVSYQTCRGLVSEATESLTAALTLLEGLPEGPELARALYAEALLTTYTGNFTAALEPGRRAIELAERFDEPLTLVEASVIVATIEMLRDGIEGCIALEKALQLARQHELPAQIARSMHNLALGGIAHGSPEVAAVWLERGLAYCDDQELDLWRLALLALRVRYELDRGDWASATETADLIRAEVRDSPEPGLQALLVLALVRARRGDPDVLPLLEEAAEIAAEANDMEWHAALAAARAEIAWITRRDAGIDELTRGAFDAAVERGAEHWVGEIGYWRRKNEVADDLPPGVGAPWSLHLAGDWEAAAAGWEARRRPYEVALALSEADDEHALRQALEGFRKLGAAPLSAMVSRRLRERGIRGVSRGPRRATRQSPGGLTPRETEVLGLVAEGLTNAEIATSLFLSTRTVDHHMSSILRKLAVPSRARASAEAIRLGIVARS